MTLYLPTDQAQPRARNCLATFGDNLVKPSSQYLSLKSFVARIKAASSGEARKSSLHPRLLGH